MDTSQPYDDEIDLFQLFETIWQGKWLIISITALFGAGGLGFIVLGPSSYQGSVVLQPQSSAYISRFSALNDIPSLTDQVLDANGNAIRGKFITGERLLDIFIREFNDYRELRQAVTAVSPAVLEADFDSQEDRERVIIALARDFTLAPGKNETAHSIQFEGTDPDEIRAILNRAVADINRSVAQATRVNIENLRESTRVGIMNEIEQVQSTLDSKIRAYQYEVAGTVAYLREQAAIARELGIEQGDVGSPRDQAGVSVTVETQRPFYTRGYRAIEKEIALIEGRSPESYGYYIEGYRDLVERRELLLTDTRVGQIDRALDQLPLGEDFQAVIIDLDLMDIESKTKAPLILALSIVLGGMVAVLYVLIRSGFQNYQARKTH